MPSSMNQFYQHKTFLMKLNLPTLPYNLHPLQQIEQARYWFMGASNELSFFNIMNQLHVRASRSLHPRISINNGNTCLVPCPTIMGTYEKLLYFLVVKQIICRWKMDFPFCNFFGTVMTQYWK